MRPRGRFRFLLPSPPVVCQEPADVDVDPCLPERKFSLVPTHKQATRRGKILAKITRARMVTKPKPVKRKRKRKAKRKCQTNPKTTAT